MFTPKGRFGWYELMTSDTDAAARFYSDVVGWKTDVMPNPTGPPYTIFKVGEAGIAGMINVPGHVAWVGYLAVEDVDAHVEHVVAAGGKLLRAATDVPGMLRFAVMADPQGAAIVIFTPVAGMVPAPAPPQAPTPGTIGWHELHTSDLDAGFSFYEKLFGWSKMMDMDMGPMGIYRIFDEGLKHEMGDGGMVLKAPQMPVSAWIFYICVESITAARKRVEAGGGTLVVAPMQIPGGGWILTGMDPQGAVFALTGPE